MKKILFIINSDFGIPNTIGARSLHIARQIKDKNSLKVLCRGYSENEKSNYEIMTVFPRIDIFMKFFTAIQIYISEKIPTDNIKNRVFDMLLLRRLKKIDLKKFEIIHSWDFLPKSFDYIKSANPKIKIFQDIPMAFAENSGKFLKNNNLPSFILDSLKYIDYYIVPSEFVKNSLENIGINQDKIRLVPFGVDVLGFKPMKKSNKIFKVAFAGNVNNRKGIPLLIQTWKEMNLKNAQLNLYGRVYPEVKNHLIDAKKYNIMVHGFVNIKKELPKNDIFAFPSLLEGSAKSVYEALASGLPVITTDNAGSVIKNGKEGFIIKINDKVALKEKILYFYTNKKQLVIFSKNARKLSQNYSWEKYGKEVNKVYLN